MISFMYENKYHSCDLSSKSFLITGGAGFIGSNIVEYLLRHGAGKVRVLDNLSTGFWQNVAEFQHHSAYEFIEGDIRDFDTCKRAVNDISYVSHQAALGSVPRSITDPLSTNEVNISGFFNMLTAVKESAVERFVYAASSSTYGDSKELPKVEDKIGKPLSPYAITKYVNELYAYVFSKTYGVKTIGLRYFNIFGPKQSPEGAYAAVIPSFIKAAKENKPANITGDGEQTRDFTFVENAVQANIKAFFVNEEIAVNQIYNIACGKQISLNQLWRLINEIADKNIQAVYQPLRTGDIKHSLADISKASALLNYVPITDFKSALQKSMEFLITK